MRTTRNGRRAWDRLLRLGVRAKAVVAAGVIVTSGSSAVLAAESSLRISVYVYNAAPVPARTLRKAQDGAAKIFEKAGIRITWREPRPSVAEGAGAPDPWVPTNIEVRIYKRHMIDEVPVKEEVTGFVWSFETNTAAILYDRVQNLAASKFANVTPILGIVMAHEIAHLLLRSGEHSSEGIMRRNWSSGDLQSAAQGRLRFTAEQSRRMRDEARRGSPQPPGTSLKIEIDVYNYSKIPQEMFVRAEQESARIFERIGVGTIWVDCPLTSQEAVRNRASALSDAPTRLTLRLLSNSMADSLGVGGDIFGSALLPANEGFGVVANVYADRTRELADGREFEVILGRVIAHELGHLLLGKNAHSAAGIMHARWRAQDLGLSRQAAMLFLPGEAKRIRAQVIARTAGQLSLTSVELPISNLSAATSHHRPWALLQRSPGRKAEYPPRIPGRKLVVRLYDYAQVPRGVLTWAEQETARVFQIAGIQLSWVECGLSEAHKERFLDCEHATDPLRFFVNIIPQLVAPGLPPGEFGTSLGDERHVAALRL